MPHRNSKLFVLSHTPLDQLERELERRKRRLESNRLWLRREFDRLAKEQEEVAALEAIVHLQKETRH